MSDKKAQARELALRIADMGLDKKAVDVEVLDVSSLVSYTDYMLIMSGRSDRQVVAIADHIEEKLKGDGMKAIGVEGKSSRQWVLMDFGDVIVHIFYEGVRSYYDLERLWHDAPRIEVEQQEEKAAAGAGGDVSSDHRAQTGRPRLAGAPI